MSGKFVISLDFELIWGVHDHGSLSDYRTNIIGARDAIPRILELFEKYEIQATWATVGFLFAESKDELLSSLPPQELRPRYCNSALSTYNELRTVGENEVTDPVHFGFSLIKQILAAPGQEIGTHTLSHYYCLEPGQTLTAFEADISCALALARGKGITINSIVFPRNQYTQAHLDVCRKNGISAWRGNPRSWPYRAVPQDKQNYLRRSLRLADSITGILGSHSFQSEGGSFRNITASHFLRPYGGPIANFYSRHLDVLKKCLCSAARNERGFHLWWHPHNFGRDTKENLQGLESVLQSFDRLRETHGMKSVSMGGC